MNFDNSIDRKKTCALKWANVEKEGKADVIPLWVADMDFPAPLELTAVLKERANHPVYGYAQYPPGFSGALTSWYRRRYRLCLEEEHFLPGPGVVPSLGIAVRAFSAAAEGVLIFTPVYAPFYDMIRSNRRETVEVPLALTENGRYEFSQALLEETLAAAEKRGLHVPLALLCSPHNPGGTVWKRHELETLLAFAKCRGIIVVADEIHGDFVYPPEEFVSLLDFPEYADRVAVTSGANKTFNTGGLHLSHFVTRDKGLREALQTGMRAMGWSNPDVFASLAVETLYSRCEYWFNEVKPYIRANILEAVRYINEKIDGVKAYTPEGTYLIWADASGLIARLGLGDDVELVKRLEAEGRVKFTVGSIFGAQGRGFLRINAACPRPLLMEGLQRFCNWGM